ncbi:polysaccharide deacetylase family protein [Clostridium sp. 1001271B_151109_B4]|uniref:polysaccharide deacetylase family protein n=1 Tax=Clostridium sp. 1001271B_151109_B4 TaxID=2787148 RepID=UPI0018A8D1C8|nr:polysaccharide deacetylase family protein [Clostridium sp. 1001271B_151109_B4]
MKKRFIAITFLLLITFGMIACGKNEILKEENINETNQEEVTENQEQQEDTSEITSEEEQNMPEVEYINIAPEEVRIPILMYHSISDEDPSNNLLVPPAMFEEQMAWLEANNFTAMNLDEALEAMETGKVPKRPVVITFDDGYANNYSSAFPSLKNHNLKATFFIITDGVDNGYYMSSDNLKEMQAAGMSIENHTANHLELNGLSKEDAYDSIKRAQDYLRNVIGSDGNYLCYPVGKYNDETIAIEEELGIKAAVTTQGGIASINDGIHTLKRVRISPMSIESFASIFSEYIE